MAPSRIAKKSGKGGKATPLSRAGDEKKKDALLAEIARLQQESAELSAKKTALGASGAEGKDIEMKDIDDQIAQLDRRIQGLQEDAKMTGVDEQADGDEEQADEEQTYEGQADGQAADGAGEAPPRVKVEKWDPENAMDLIGNHDNRKPGRSDMIDVEAAFSNLSLSRPLISASDDWPGRPIFRRGDDSTIM